MRTGPGRNYPGTWLYVRPDLPIRVLEVYQSWRKIRGSRRHDRLDAGQPAQRHAHRASSAATARGRCTSSRTRPRRCASAPSPAWSAASRAARAGWCHFDVGGRNGFIRTDHLWGVGRAMRRSADDERRALTLAISRRERRPTSKVKTADGDDPAGARRGAGAARLPAATAAAFRLEFHGPLQPCSDQGIYRFRLGRGPQRHLHRADRPHRRGDALRGDLLLDREAINRLSIYFLWSHRSCRKPVPTFGTML